MKRMIVFLMLIVAVFTIATTVQQAQPELQLHTPTACAGFMPEILKPPQLSDTQLCTAGLSIDIDNWLPIVAFGVTLVLGWTGFKKIIKVLTELKEALAKATEIFADGKVTPEELKELKKEIVDVVDSVKSVFKRDSNPVEKKDEGD